MIVVFGFNEGQRDVWFPRQQEVGKLPLSPFDSLPTYMYLARRKEIFFTNLILNVPAGRRDGWHNVLGADIAFAELLFIHRADLPA